MEEEILGTCYMCGQPLQWDPTFPNCDLEEGAEEDSVIKHIQCEHCGTEYHNWVDIEDITKLGGVVCNDQGFGRCFHCGGYLIWQNDFMRSDFETKEDGSDLDDCDNSIVQCLSCSRCGSSVEAWEPTPNEMKDYPYWEEN